MVTRSFDADALKTASERSLARAPDYSVSLARDGGELSGWVFSGDDAQKIAQALCAETLIVGDGNHSLAAAKSVWDASKPQLSERGQKAHPKRFCLAEICPLSGDGLAFLPIHRVIFGVELSDIQALFPQSGRDAAGHVHHMRGKNGSVGIYRKVTEALDKYLSENPNAKIDYIHGADEVSLLAAQEKTVGIIMPAVSKEEFYAEAVSGRVLPRKSFSIGQANEKRVYLEARFIGEERI
jgi:uncharacterized protein (DUF1015 family)